MSGNEKSVWSKMTQSTVSPRIFAYNKHRELQKKQLVNMCKHIGLSEQSLGCKDKVDRVGAVMVARNQLGKAALMESCDDDGEFVHACDPQKVFEEILRKN